MAHEGSWDWVVLMSPTHVCMYHNICIYTVFHVHIQHHIWPTVMCLLWPSQPTVSWLRYGTGTAWRPTTSSEASHFLWRRYWIWQRRSRSPSGTNCSTKREPRITVKSSLPTMKWRRYAYSYTTPFLWLARKLQFNSWMLATLVVTILIDCLPTAPY